MDNVTLEGDGFDNPIFLTFNASTYDAYDYSTVNAATGVAAYTSYCLPHIDQAWLQGKPLAAALTCYAWLSRRAGWL